MKGILIGGSIAYDSIMAFGGSFKESILPENLENLSVSFLAHERKNYFGGCGANVAYSLKLLGGRPIISGVAGNDFDHYRKWLEACGISTDLIEVDDENPCAAAYILGDEAQRQITIFAPGAMQTFDKAMSLDGVDAGEIEVAIIGAEMPQRMMKFAEECVRLGIKYFFDPGQAMSAISQEQIEYMVEHAAGVMVNEYEADMLADKLKRSLDEIVGSVGFFVRTLGSRGAEVFQRGEHHVIEAIAVDNVADVTGCGDAFRAGFLYGYVNGESLKRCCEIGCTVSSFVIVEKGTQEHKFDMAEFEARLSKYYPG